MRKAKTLAVLSLTFLTAVAGTDISRADDCKPKAQPAATENINVNFTKLETSYREGSPGPSISLTGILHLVSRTLVSDDGTPVGFILDTNLSDGVAAGID